MSLRREQQRVKIVAGKSKMRKTDKSFFAFAFSPLVARSCVLGTWKIFSTFLSLSLFLSFLMRCNKLSAAITPGRRLARRELYLYLAGYYYYQVLCYVACLGMDTHKLQVKFRKPRRLWNDTYILYISVFMDTSKSLFISIRPFRRRIIMQGCIYF